MAATTFCDDDQCTVVRCDGGDAACPEPEDWAFLGDAAVISLNDPVSERRRRVLRQAFAPMGLAGKIRDLVVERHPKGGVVGCFTSHQLAVRRMIERDPDIEWGAVFEDDARPFPEAVRRDLVQELGRFCAAHGPNKPAWVQLGFVAFLPFVSGSGEKVGGFSSVYKINETLATHAYVLNRAAMEIVLSLDGESGVPFDDAVTCGKMLRESGKSIEMFATDPQMFFQCDCGSTVTGGIITFLQSVIGYANVQRFGSFVAFHPAWTVALMVLAGVLVATMLVGGFWLAKTPGAGDATRIAGSCAFNAALLGLFVVVAMVLTRACAF